MKQTKLLLLAFIIMFTGCSGEHSHDDNSHSHESKKHDSIN